VLGIKNANKLVPLKDGDDMKPRDPVSENMDVLNGKPVKAFLYQDHEAHIAVHMAAMQDPKMAELIGQNPNAQSMMAAAAAHIQEHLAFAYRKQIEEQAGVPLPPPNAEMDEDTELAVSRLAAAAAAQLLQKNQAEAQQQQNQQMQQDPIIQMQQQELQIKQGELQIKQGELDLKKQKLQVDAAEKQDRLELEMARIESQEEIAGLNVGAKLATSRSQLDAKQEEAGLRMGIEVARESLQSEQPVPNQATPKENE
jgi:hypothetical protein